MPDEPFLDRLKRLFAGGAPVPTGGQPPAPVPSAPPSFDYADSRIPEAARPKLAQVQALAADIEAQAERAGTITDSGADALTEARRIRDIYAPDLLRSYFDIPAAHRAEIFRRTGRSASFQLGERLDTMIEELRRISAQFAAGQLDRFSVKLGFIDKRFEQDSKGSDWL
jgi:hypothetical protein